MPFAIESIYRSVKRENTGGSYKAGLVKQKLYFRREWMGEGRRMERIRQ